MAEQASIEQITNLSRRAFLAAAGAVGVGRVASMPARAAIVRTDFSTLPAYGNGTGSDGAGGKKSSGRGRNRLHRPVSPGVVS
jgi:hypothetical protein